MKYEVTLGVSTFESSCNQDPIFLSTVETIFFKLYIISWLWRPRLSLSLGWDQVETNQDFVGYCYVSLGCSIVESNLRSRLISLDTLRPNFRNLRLFLDFKDQGWDLGLYQDHVETDQDFGVLQLCKPAELNSWEQLRSRSISLDTSRTTFWNCRLFLDYFKTKGWDFSLGWDPQA